MPRKVEIQPPPELAVKFVLVGQEGVGKTSFPAYAPKPHFLMHKMERGYQTLASAGRLPSCTSAVVEDWQDLLGWIDDLIANPQGVKTLVLDALTGFAADCEEYITQTAFGGSRARFTDFGKGYDLSADEFRKFLESLERLHQEHRMNVVCLVHSNTTRFKNPDGNDYDRWAGDLRDKVWDMVRRWPDELLFMKFESTTIGAKRPEDKGKGRGRDERVIQARHGATTDAKSRHGLPARIEIGNDVSQVWPAVWRHIEPQKGTK